MDVSLSYSQEKTKNITNINLERINNFVNIMAGIKKLSPEGKDAMNTLKKGIKSYTNSTTHYSDLFRSHEGTKDTISIVMVIFFIVIIVLYCFLTFKKLKEPMDFISNITFVTIPMFLGFTGVIAIYFMITFDFCNSIHSSIYKDQRPIYNKGVGKLFNCFDSVI